MSAWYQINDREVILTLHVSPNAAKTRVVGIYGDALKVAIKALPENGAANKELIRFLAEQCQLTKKQVEIHHGKTSQRKKVCMSYTPAVERFIKTV